VNGTLLFSPIEIGSHKLRNRIVRSATYEGLATPEGLVTPLYQKHYTRLARLGPAAIVTGFAFVSQEGRSMQPLQASAADDRNVAAWRTMNREIHEQGAKIYLQLAHTGRQTHPDSTKMEVVAPGPKASPYFRSRPRSLREEEIPTRVEQFVQAARLAQSAGFDGVQVHAAHGYLIHQFLTPAVNCRNDGYGVDSATGIASRFLGEILQGIRKACGRGFDCWIKVSHGDELQGGMNSLRFASLMRFLQEQPVDAIEVSYGSMDHALNIFRGGIPLDRIVAYNPRYRITHPRLAAIWKKIAAPFAARPLKAFEPCYNLRAARQAKETGTIPVISVGGFRNGTVMEDALQSGNCDLIALSRPFIAEPNLVQRLKNDLNYQVRCTNCNQCAVMCDAPSPTLCYTQGRNERK
jgi:2,4-dienoyl-CoA reductase-like NADH-dependent reductase (Old Yellow Enzyme family)